MIAPWMVSLKYRTDLQIEALMDRLAGHSLLLKWRRELSDGTTELKYAYDYWEDASVAAEKMSGMAGVFGVTVHERMD